MSCIAWADYKRHKAEKTSVSQNISEAYKKKEIQSK